MRPAPCAPKRLAGSRPALAAPALYGHRSLPRRSLGVVGPSAVPWSPRGRIPHAVGSFLSPAGDQATAGGPRRPEETVQTPAGYPHTKHAEGGTVKNAITKTVVGAVAAAALAITATSCAGSAVNPEPPEPATTIGSPLELPVPAEAPAAALNDTINSRHSVRTFAAEPLSQTDLPRFCGPPTATAPMVAAPSRRQVASTPSPSLLRSGTSRAFRPVSTPGIPQPISWERCPRAIRVPSSRAPPWTKPQSALRPPPS